MKPANPSYFILPQPEKQPLRKLEIITTADDFKMEEQIEGNQYSTVFKGMLRGVPVAIKVARIEGRKNILKELLIYDKINHPHVLQALGVHLGIDNMLFLELRTYNLRDYFYDYGNGLKFEQLKKYTIQVADAMTYLHKKQILHCDLKIDNILIKDEKATQIEICDFACSIDFARDSPNRYCGTITHTSYELLKHVCNHKDFKGAHATKASDVWAFGVTMWQIFQKADQLPIDFVRKEDIIKNYEAGKKLPIPLTVSEDFWRYIFLPCFDLHPSARPSMEDLHKRLSRFQENSDACHEFYQ